MAFPFPKIPTAGDLKEDIKRTFVDPILGDFGRKKIDIDTYKAKFLGQNARAYLFLCSVQFPGMQNAIKSGVLSGMKSLDLQNVGSAITKGLLAGAGTAITSGNTSLGTDDFKYFVRSTTLPESTVEETSTFFCGSQYKQSSVRRSQDWMVSFLVNDDASIIRKFWDWHLILHNPETGVYGKPEDYMVDQKVQLLGLDGTAICTYKLINAWPKSIGPVDLDYSTNEFATIDITFSYQYHTVTRTDEPAAMAMGRKMVNSIGNNLINKG
jgi:hypothetical protein